MVCCKIWSAYNTSTKKICDGFKETKVWGIQNEIEWVYQGYACQTRYIVNCLAFLGKTYTSGEQVNKILRSLLKAWESKKTTTWGNQRSNETFVG